jgi:hypothetical protein
VVDVTTQDNIGEGHPTLASAKGQNPRVFVISLRGKPLMPTYASKARKLLATGKAKLVKRTPFTIQLLSPTGETKQPISLGVDAGTHYIGLSATTEKAVLYEGEVELRTDITGLIADRKNLRKDRRRRKTRYRPARFSNRTRATGWLPPSMQHKVRAHVAAVNFLHAIMPIHAVIVEIAKFDIEKIKNPAIHGADYQHGPQEDYDNVRAYCLDRDNYTCLACKGASKNKYLNVHHIESRKTGGSSPDNLVTLCASCHKTLHKEKLEGLLKRRRTFKDAGCMNVIGGFIYSAIKDIVTNTKITYGYITGAVRKRHSLSKTHGVDARCISGNPTAERDCAFYRSKQVRGQNRQIHKVNAKKGKRRRSKAEKYVLGFKLFDKVRYFGTECFIFGRRASGFFDVRLIDGTRVHASAGHKKLHRVESAKTLLTQRCTYTDVSVSDNGQE